MVMLQSAALGKEEQRILAMKARAEARTHRFLNARSRTIGIDVNGLNAQIAEKKQMKEAQRQADADQSAYDQHVIRVLEKNEEDARSKRHEDMVQLKQDLLAHAKEPKNNCDKIGTSIVAEDCSRGAAQYFSGEDKLRAERIRMQHAQMRQWTRQQVAEKDARSLEIKEEALRYDQYMNAVDTMRGEMEDNNNRQVHETRMQVRHLNEERAAEQAENKRNDMAYNEQLNRMQIDSAAKSAFLNEETDYGVSALASHRLRPDHFKGYNKEQRLYIFKDNERVHREKIQADERNADEEMAWAAHQERVSRMMEAAEQQDKEHKDYINQVQAQDLEEQTIELKAKQQKMKEDKFGAIGEGFFQGFGTSCR